jgi:hypothetical protein
MGPSLATPEYVAMMFVCGFAFIGFVALLDNWLEKNER